jgi:hypothetical protein
MSKMSTDYPYTLDGKWMKDLSYTFINVECIEFSNVGCTK